MSRPCSVCRHPQRAEISLALVAGASYRTVADRFGGLSKTSLLRHRPHVGAGLVKTAAAIVKDAARHGAEVREFAEAESVIQKLGRNEADNRRIGERAESEGDLRAALVANAGLLNVIKLMHEMMPASDTTPGVEVRFVFDSPETQRYAESFEARQERQRGAATDRTTDAADSSTTEDAEVSQPIVAHEEQAFQSRPKTSEVIAEPAPGTIGPLNVNLGNYRTGALRGDGRDE